MRPRQRFSQAAAPEQRRRDKQSGARSRRQCRPQQLHDVAATACETSETGFTVLQVDMVHIRLHGWLRVRSS